MFALTLCRLRMTASEASLTPVRPLEGPFKDMRTMPMPMSAIIAADGHR